MFVCKYIHMDYSLFHTDTIRDIFIFISILVFKSPSSSFASVCNLFYYHSLFSLFVHFVRIFHLLCCYCSLKYDEQKWGKIVGKNTRQIDREQEARQSEEEKRKKIINWNVLYMFLKWEQIKSYVIKQKVSFPLFISNCMGDWVNVYDVWAVRNAHKHTHTTENNNSVSRNFYCVQREQCLAKWKLK